MALQWLSLVGVIWLQSINGTNSNFPAYSSQLKRLLSMSQLQLNYLAFASDAGKLLGWSSGIASVHLPLHLVLLIGSSLGFLGYGLQYLFVSEEISLSYWHVFLLTVLAGNSICWINTVCYIITIKNFPLDRQIAVGLTTSYSGLSAKIYTAIVDSDVNSSPIERAKRYLFLSAILPLAISFITMPALRQIDGDISRKLTDGFVVMFAITVITGTYAVITSFGSVIWGHIAPFFIPAGMGIFLLVPLLIPLGEKIRETMQKKCSIRERERRVYDVGAVVEEGGGGGGGDPEKEEESGGEEVGVGVREEIGVREMVKRVEFWLYYLVYLLGATVGLVFLNNLGQIAESRGCGRTSALVSLSSSFGFFGRLSPSFLDYYFTRIKYRASKPAFMAAMTAPMAVAFFLLLKKTNVFLFVSTATIGICSGAITSLAVSITTELFGAKNFGLNHNILVTNIPIGSFIFGDMAARLYRRSGRGDGRGDGRCMGMECYRTTFVIWGSLCLLGSCLALVLHARTKKFYSQKV